MSWRKLTAQPVAPKTTALIAMQDGEGFCLLASVYRWHADRWISEATGTEFFPRSDRDYCPVRIDEGYACAACGEFHRKHADAAQCCAEIATGIWHCHQCEETFFVAEDCCEHIDFDEPPMPTPAQLEAFGQLRLLP